MIVLDIILYLIKKCFGITIILLIGCSIFYFSGLFLSYLSFEYISTEVTLFLFISFLLLWFSVTFVLVFIIV